MKKALAIFFVIALAVVLSGCGEKAVETAIETSSGGEADVDIDDQTMTVNTNAGSLTVGEEVSLPEGFPSDVYVIDGELQAAMTTGEDNYNISLETDKTVSEVKQEYEAALADDGWTIVSSLDMPGFGANIAAEKGDRYLSVSVSQSAEDSDKTTVVVSVSQGD